MADTIVYDDGCAFCRRMVGWVAAHDARRRFEALPCQSPQRAERFPQLAEADCLAAVQVVGEDGAAVVAEEAVGHILRALPGWGWLGRLCLSRPLRPVAAWGYRWMAANRRRLGCGC